MKCDRKSILDSIAVLEKARKLKRYCRTKNARKLVARIRGDESMTVFSKRIGVSANYVSLIERGESKISLKVLERVLRVALKRRTP